LHWVWPQPWPARSPRLGPTAFRGSLLSPVSLVSLSRTSARAGRNRFFERFLDLLNEDERTRGVEKASTSNRTLYSYYFQ
jgi:hypothetical protein